MQQQKLSNKNLTQFAQQLGTNQAQLVNFINAYIDFKGDKEDFKGYLEKLNKKNQEKQKK